MIFDLVKDFADVLDAMPEGQPRRRILKLLDEAIRRDAHFIDRHPTTFFQCMWNTCWWYDSPEATEHYEEPEAGWQEPPPWNLESKHRLCDLLEFWKSKKELHMPGFVWLCARRPPTASLDTSLLNSIRDSHGSIECVALSHDGTRVAGGGSDTTLYVWHAANGTRLATGHGHSETITSVAFTRDGRFIVTGSEDRTVRIWEAESGAAVAVLHGHRREVTSVAISPDDRRIASASYDQTIREWDWRSGREVSCLGGHTHWVMSIAYSPDGTRIVSGSKDHTVRLWDVARTESEFDERHTTHEYSSRFSESERVLPSLCLRESSNSLYGVEGEVVSVAFSPDGRYLVSAHGPEDTARVWNARSGECLQVLSHPRRVECVTFLEEGRRLITGSYDGLVRLWDAISGELKHSHHGHGGIINGVSFASDGKQFVSGCSDGTVCLWKDDPATELRQLVGHNDYFGSISFSPKGDLIASASQSDMTIRLWESSSCRQIHCLRGHVHYERSPVNSSIEVLAQLDLHVAFAREACRFASGLFDGIRVWDAQTGLQLQCLKRNNKHVKLHDLNCIALSADGSRIACGHGDGTVHIWSPKLGRMRRASRYVLALLREKIVFRAPAGPDAESSDELFCLRAHTRSVGCIAFAPKGPCFASGSDDHSVRVWNADTGDELIVFQGHRSAVDTIAFWEDGKRVASRSADGAEFVWDVNTGAVISEEDRPASFDKELHDVRTGAVLSGRPRRTGRHIMTDIDQSQIEESMTAVAGVPDRVRLRATDGTTIELRDTGQPVAWFPQHLSRSAMHPHTAMWTGFADNEVQMIELHWLSTS